MSTFRNAATSTFGDGTLIRTRARGLDVDWTSHGPKVNGCYRYVMRTWVPASEPGTYLPSTTTYELEVVKAEGAGWQLVLWGETQPEVYADKGYAQHAAEAIALVAP